MSNEAIHNYAKSKFCNGIFKGEIKDYRLPRLRTKSRNDKRAKSAYRLPRVINHARNDCDSRIINMLDYESPRFLTESCNDIMRNLLIMDCRNLIKGFVRLFQDSR